MRRQTRVWMMVAIAFIVVAIVFGKFGKIENACGSMNIEQDDFEWDRPGQSSINPF